ncbi:MAG: serine/threonine protein kinase [Myxococcales bacterium]|nr:serine/threonine protein kinase [Myxococcales bacterium]
MAEFEPQPFGKYLLLNKIAVGGMAEIFRAKSLGAEGFEREIVIKRILPSFSADDNFVTMFVDEARLAAKLHHANIVQIFDFDKADGTYYIAMEYIEGTDLRRILERCRQYERHLSPPQAVWIAVEVCKALHYAHTRKHKNEALNLVHRDVSPHNIMVSYNGEVKLTDFGIAKAASRSTATRVGLVKGKCSYMSPEQARGKPLDGRSDLFALGIVLWEMLTDRRLFTGDTEIETLQNVLRCEVESPSRYNRDVPPELDEIVRKSLASQANDRYRDVGAFQFDLERFLYNTVTDSSDINLAETMHQLFADEIAKLSEQQAQEKTVHFALTPKTMPPSGANAGGLPNRAAETDHDEVKTVAMSAILPNEAPTVAMDSRDVRAVLAQGRPSGGGHAQGGVVGGLSRHTNPPTPKPSRTKVIWVTAVLLASVTVGVAISYVIATQDRAKPGNGGGVVAAEDFQPAKDDRGGVVVVTAPKDAEIYAAGTLLGVGSGRYDVVLGSSVTFEAKRNGFQPKVKNVTIKPGENIVEFSESLWRDDKPSPAAAVTGDSGNTSAERLPKSNAAATKGTVVIESTPKAEVWMGTKNFGMTPVTAEVPAGRQAFVLKVGSHSETVTITVPPGGTVTKAFTVDVQ